MAQSRGAGATVACWAASALIAAGAACSSGGKGSLRDAGHPDAGQGAGAADGAGSPGRATLLVPEILNRDVDVLFMIDDSPSMEPLIQKLLASFQTFVGALEALPGGLPNLHLAVISSDLGAGQTTRIVGCAPDGNRGEFQDTLRPGPSCAFATTGLPPNQSFISNVGGVANYDAGRSIADVFGCIADLGQAGCGYEHQLQSVVRALGADINYPLPDKNAGFLREQAYLAVVLFTNEDDCSAPPDTALFDPNMTHVADPFGQLASYRCNEFGHLCGNPPAKPPHDMSTGAPTGDLTPCHSAEDGILLKISDLAAELKALKADPRSVLVSVIGGPPSPYQVQLVAPQTPGDPMAPAIAHSCMQSSGEYADPGVRLFDFAAAFSDNGLYLPVCATSFAPALTSIAQQIGNAMLPSCFVADFVDRDGNPSNGVQPDCTVVGHVYTAAGQVVVSDIPEADSANPSLCPPAAPGAAPPAGCQPSWSAADDARCPGGKVFAVSRPSPPTIGTYDVISCAVCGAGSADPRCP